MPLQVLGRTLAKAWHDRILGLSAEAAFWQILSVPPLLIGLLGSLGYLGSLIGDDAVRQIEDQLLSASARVLTSDVVDDLVAPTLSDILGSGRLDVVSLGFLLALWAGSSATATFMNTIVIAYDQRDVRGPDPHAAQGAVAVRRRHDHGRADPAAARARPRRPGRPAARATGGTPAMVLVNAVYWPVVLIGLLLALTSFYHVVLPQPAAVAAAPARHACSRWRSSSSPPCVLRAYVADILITALPYGALAAPIGALLFCFFFGMAVLLGAELNATIQARWPAPLRRHDRRRRADGPAEARSGSEARAGLRADCVLATRPSPHGPPS